MAKSKKDSESRIPLDRSAVWKARISELINSKGLKQAALVDLLEIDGSAVSNNLNSMRANFFTIPQLKTIASEYGVTLDYLVADDNVAKSRFSLSDYFNMLFVLEKISPIQIKGNSISFSDPCVSELLEQWGKLKETGLSEMVEVWKEKARKDYQDKIFVDGFIRSVPGDLRNVISDFDGSEFSKKTLAVLENAKKDSAAANELISKLRGLQAEMEKEESERRDQAAAESLAIDAAIDILES